MDILKISLYNWGGISMGIKFLKNYHYYTMACILSYIKKVTHQTTREWLNHYLRQAVNRTGGARTLASLIGSKQDSFFDAKIWFIVKEFPESILHKVLDIRSLKPSIMLLT